MEGVQILKNRPSILQQSANHFFCEGLFRKSKFFKLTIAVIAAIKDWEDAVAPRAQADNQPSLQGQHVLVF